MKTKIDILEELTDLVFKGLYLGLFITQTKGPTSTVKGDILDIYHNRYVKEFEDYKSNTLTVKEFGLNNEHTHSLILFDWYLNKEEILSINHQQSQRHFPNCHIQTERITLVPSSLYALLKYMSKDIDKNDYPIRSDCPSLKQLLLDVYNVEWYQPPKSPEPKLKDFDVNKRFDYQ